MEIETTNTLPRSDHAKMLTAAALLTIFLFVVHLADDIARGIEAGDLNDLTGGTGITLVWLYGTLVLRHRLAGLIIMFVGGVFSVLVPYSHMRGAGIGQIAASTGGVWYALTLLLMALAGVFSAILAIHCFWDRRKTKKPA